MISVIVGEHRFQVEKGNALQFGVIQRLLEDVGQECTEIPINNVSPAIMKLMLDFIQDGNMDHLPTTDCTDWSYYKEVFEAAIFLDCKCVVDAMAEKLACIIRGKNPNQIRQIFGITTDWSEEEKKKIEEEEKWLKSVYA